MSFVFPALLATTVLAGIPILLHLILRQKPKSLPFPAFRFLVVRHQTNQRKLQLRHWLLLALRVLLIAGLIFAIARPRLLQSSLGLSSERPVAAVFVIDISASMDARSTDKRSRLDDVKRRALEMLDELPAGSRVAVLSSSDVRGDWLANPFQARQRIQNLKIQPACPPLPRSLIAALRLLSDVATKREDDVATRLPRLLCVFSDTTRGAWAPALTPQVLEASDQVPVPRDTLLEAKRDIGPALAALKDGNGPLKELLTELRDIVPQLTPAMFPLQDRSLQLVQQTRAATRESLKLFSSGESALKDEAKEKLAANLRSLLVHLSGYQTMWFDVGLNPPRDFAILDIEWPVNSSGMPQETVRPGEKLLLSPLVQGLGEDYQATLAVGAVKVNREVKSGSQIPVPIEIDTTAQKLGPGYHSFAFNVDVRDSLEANNQRFATIEVRKPRKGLVIAPDSRAPEDLVRALRSNDGRIYDAQFDVCKPADVKGDFLSQYHFAFLYAVPAPSDELWQSLERFALAGGGIAVIPGGDEMDVRAYQTPAAKALLPGTYEKRRGTPDDEKTATMWDWKAAGVFRHPLLQPFENWLRESTFDIVQLPRRVFAFWETTPVANGKVLIPYQDAAHSPALLERKIGPTGKVLQFTTPFGVNKPYWNTYHELISSFYVAITGLTVKHLAGELDSVHLNFVLGREEAILPLRNLKGPLTLHRPEGGPIALDEQSIRISLPQANVPGNYQIKNDANATLAAFSMNLPPEEIDLTAWPSGEIENLFGAGVRVPPNRQADLRQLLQGRFSEPVELFPAFMVALLVLLAIENLLANRFYRRDGEQASKLA